MTLKKNGFKQMMRWALLIGLQLSIVQVLPAQKRITLEQCIERALEANYSIKMIRNQEKIAANDLNYSPFLPTLGVTAGQKQTIND